MLGLSMGRLMEPPIPNPTPPPPPPQQKASRFALRFISGKYQGGEFPLPENGEIAIGRSSELDMVLVEDMVSRRHAQIVAEAGDIFLEDLGSTNGSFVNGERVTRMQLKEGDRILIGTSIIKVVESDGSVVEAKDQKQQLESMASAKRTSQVRTMTGSIGEVPLPDLLQLFSASKKTGVLAVSTGHNHGRIFMKDGRVIHATIGSGKKVPAKKAFYRILTWEQGTFEMEPAEEPVDAEDPIEMSTEGLLMEAMRQIDELKRLGDDLPSLDAAVRIATPLEPSLRDLSPEELDVLQLVHNANRVEDILNESKASDLETAEVLVKLVSRGYVQA